MADPCASSLCTGHDLQASLEEARQNWDAALASKDRALQQLEEGLAAERGASQKHRASASEAVRRAEAAEEGLRALKAEVEEGVRKLQGEAERLQGQVTMPGLAVQFSCVKSKLTESQHDFEMELICSAHGPFSSVGADEERLCLRDCQNS